MNKTKRLKHIVNHNRLFPYEIKPCRNCGELAAHYIPAGFGDKGGFVCEATDV